MSKLVMGYWDCPYCEQTKIEGIHRECPSCGHPREKGTKFYMKQGEKQYLTKEEGKKKGKGADWICGACDTLNSVLDDHCKSCGSPRDIRDGDYFSKREKEVDTFSHNDSYSSSKTAQKFQIKSTYLLVFAIFVMLGVSIFLLSSIFAPKIENFHVDNIYWQTTQEVETMKTYHESGWSIPEGGRQTDKKWVIKKYEPVLDHYETVQKSRQVEIIDHYDTKSSYTDNGDGTFTEDTYQVPVYRTKTEYYTEKEPVYRDEPVYAWKYWYDIDRWKVTDKLVETGEKDVIIVTYAAVQTNETTRAGNKYVQYFCEVIYIDGKNKGKSETYKLSEEIYEKLKNNTDIVCKIQFGNIIEVLE